MFQARIHFLAVIIIVCVNFISLWQILDSPYLGDDSWRESTIRGIALLADKSLSEICWATLKDYASSGRWYPLVIYYCPVFFYLDQKAYKTLTLVFTVFNVIAFGYLVRFLTFSRSAGLLAMTLPPLFFQLRFYHDPILSYYFLMQIEFSLITASLIFFLLHLRGSRRIFMPLSVLTFTACLLVYESAVAFCVLPMLVAYFSRENRLISALRETWPFLLIAFLNIGIVFFVRLKFGVHYEGVSLSLAPVAWVTAFGKQLFAALPLSYYFTSDSLGNALDCSRDQCTPLLLLVTFLWAVAWLLVSYCLMNSDTIDKKNNTNLLLILGFALWILPSVLVAFSAKYQRELKWGLGYLPVYWSHFGVMLIASAGIIWFHKKMQGLGRNFKWTVVAALAFSGALVCGTNYHNNRVVVEKYNFAEHYPRRIIENALRCGLLNPVPQFSVVLCGEPTHSWDNPPFFRLHSGLTVEVLVSQGFDLGKELGVRTIQEALADFTIPGSRDIYHCNVMQGPEALFSGYEIDFKGLGWPILRPVKSRKVDGQKTAVFYLKYDAQSRDAGYAVLAEVCSLKTNNGVVSALSSDDVYVYVGIPPGDHNHGFLFSGTRVDDSFRRKGAFCFREADLQLIGNAIHGRIYQMPRTMLAQHIDPSSIVIDCPNELSVTSRVDQGHGKLEENSYGLIVGLW